MSVASFRRHARILMWLVTVPLAGLCLLAVLIFAGTIWSGGKYLVPVLLLYLPMLLYIWAIWMVRAALKAMAVGQMFSEVIPRLLFRVGLALFGGALFNVVGGPLLAGVLQVRMHHALEVSAITLGVVGAMLVLVARLLERAASMREELDGFF